MLRFLGLPPIGPRTIGAKLGRCLAVALGLMLVTGCDDRPAVPPVDRASIQFPISQRGHSEPAIDAEALFTQHCAACHDRGINGAPRTAALRALDSGRISSSMAGGIMTQQAALLDIDEQQALARWLGKKTPPSVSTLAACDAPPNLAAAPRWNRWGNSARNQRRQTASATSLSEDTISELRLAWAFGFPGAARARSQPALIGDVAYVGSQDGTVYALGLEGPCLHWQFQAEAEVRSAPTLIDNDQGTPHLLFGDFSANLYAVSAIDGQLAWKAALQDHPDGTITGSPTYDDGQIFVPMSSTEVVSAFDDDYPCCTFRGGITAIEARTGETLWRYYTTGEPSARGVNRQGTDQYGPSGAPVWSVPTIDRQRGLVYVGTGQNYSLPATGMSSAIVALDRKTGEPVWVTQTVPEDAWNASCLMDGANCPDDYGPDFDFGAAPMLVTLKNGKDLVLAGQKSGRIFALDPDNQGTIVWQRKVGRGGYSGGIHWGMASDGENLFVGIADAGDHETAEGDEQPGLHAFALETGEPLWSHLETLRCTDHSHACQTSISAAVTAIPGAVVAGGLDGRIKAYATENGEVLWQFDTYRSFHAVNGVPTKGGSIDSAGPVVSGRRMVINSGYDKFGQIPGNALLVFELPEESQP